MKNETTKQNYTAPELHLGKNILLSQRHFTYFGELCFPKYNSTTQTLKEKAELKCLIAEARNTTYR